MRQVSERRRKRDAVYPERRRQVWERADGWCEARWDWNCSGRMEQVHHIAGRGGDDPHRLDNLLGCCAVCHHRIHSQPVEARRRGFLASKHGSTDVVSRA